MNQKIKTIILLAIPAVIENFFQTIIGFVDTFFVSKLGLAEVSAVGVTNAILAIYFAVFMSIGVAANVYVANFIGANQPEKARHIGQQATVLSVIFGIIFGLITLLFAAPLLKLMGIEPEVLEAGVIYFQIVAIPSVFMSLMFVLSSVLRGAGDTRSPMKVSIVMNIFNIVFDYILIFGFWMIPALGIAGAAIATVISRVIGSLALLYYIKKSNIVGFKREYWRIDIGHQKELISLGSPAAAERLAMRAGQLVYFGFIVALGTNTFAAHQIAGNIEVFSYMIGYGFATAATILVGQQLGAHNVALAQEYAKGAVYLSVASMTVLGFLLYVAGGWIGQLFTNDADVIAQIDVALNISGIFQPFLAVMLVLTGAFQGGNNTKFPMIITIIGMWVIRTSTVWLLGIYLGWGIMGVWIAIGLDILFRAIVLWIRFQQGKWIAAKLEKGEVTERPFRHDELSRCVNDYERHCGYTRKKLLS